MRITLFTMNNLDSIVLPEFCNGQLWLKTVNNTDCLVNRVQIFAFEEKWYVKNNDEIEWKNGRDSSIELKNGMNLRGKTKDNKDIMLNVLADDLQSNKFERVAFEEGMELTIGTEDGCNVLYEFENVKQVYVRLKWKEGGWKVEVHNSLKLGVYVNGCIYNGQNIQIGDCISVFELKILFGIGFVALNNPDGKVKLKGNHIKKYVNKEKNCLTDGKSSKDELFYPSPRFKKDIKTEIIKVDAPPQNQLGEEMPFMLVVGPSMTMGMASLTTAVFAVNNAMTTGNIAAAVPSIVMSGSMVLGTVMWPIITKKYEKKQRQKKEELRKTKYTRYIDEREDYLEKVKEIQKNVYEENCIDINKCVERIYKVSRNLWERNHTQNDFLRLRVGRADIKAHVEFKYAERHFTLEDDDLQERMLDFCERPHILKNVPITISLLDNVVTGIIGNARKCREFLNGLIVQMTALYSYEEVKLVFIRDEMEEDYVKWFPHVWNNEKTERYMIDNYRDMQNVFSKLNQEFEYRKELGEEKLSEEIPYYIIISTNKNLAKKSNFIKKVCERKKHCGFSVICCYEELRELPKECSEIIELNLDSTRIFDKNNVFTHNSKFVPDIYLKEGLTKLSKKLSRILLDKNDESQSFPQMISFLEMYHVGKIEQLNIQKRWNENNPVNSLETPIGVDEQGELFKLDLHEQIHGPHGLVAGMTGSGKSEFIMTYILSLAINYHPNEVAFILIDYKGGGMAKSFEKLPHTAGIITNLDGQAIKRSLTSIESELRRRQEIFVKVSKELSVSNIDIYKYQRLYREGKVTEPLQHLFIISDEFAELKAQQPEFMEKLISTARIGRSLGVHLILATQKPAGVVDDQIWSNSRFRICLKVQEKADSMDMLKRSDAAELKDTGRFYLQVGYNEIFQLGQSAWAGAPYYPSEEAWKETDDGIDVIDKIGHSVKNVRYDKRREKYPNPAKQLDAITKFIQDIAQKEQIHIRTLWLPPLQEKITVAMLRKKYHEIREEGVVLNPIIGELDDPENQDQRILRLPVSADSNIVLYGNAGSGKTTLVTTMIYSLMEEHTPDEIQFYIMDFASETLRVFREAPHVGDVIFSHEEEKVTNIFKLLKKTMEARKSVLRDWDGDFISYNQKTQEKMPYIMVILHNYNAFRELYEEKEELVTYLSREGIKYGISFFITTNSVGGIRFKLLQNMNRQIALQLNDPTDYGVIYGKTNGLLPASCKGRGLIKMDRLYEFQTCSVTEENVLDYIREYCRAYQENWIGNGAKKVATLPAEVTVEYMFENYTGEEIPIGIETSTLQIADYSFLQNYITIITSSKKEYKSFLHAVLRWIAETRKDMIYPLFSKKDNEKVAELFELVKNRNNKYKESENPEELTATWETVWIIIGSLQETREGLSEQEIEMLDLILLKGRNDYKIHIILGDELKALQLLRYDAWYRENVSVGDGIWIGNGIQDQYLLQTSGTDQEVKNDITDEFGYIVENGNAVKIKIVKEADVHEKDIS